MLISYKVKPKFSTLRVWPDFMRPEAIANFVRLCYSYEKRLIIYSIYKDQNRCRYSLASRQAFT